MINSFSDFIYVADGALDQEFCKNVIEKFEKDDRKKPGVMGREEEQRVDTSIKDSIDLYISTLSDWKEEDKVLFDSLHEHHRSYLNKGKWRDTHSPGLGNMVDSGYQIQRTRPGSGYTWHHDTALGNYVQTKGIRSSTYIWYLNDIDEDGYTEFIDGTKVQPKTGRICIFPATWTFIHRGYPPKNQIKYIVTGWMNSK
tara:strand:- start:620 stop:1213 length:594 start_codon:yes stop_codon:yes gene_type:complete